MERVPRWIPKPAAGSSTRIEPAARVVFSWRDTFYSERGTLIAIAAGYVLLAAKRAAFGL
jgi:hypothetical protein